MTIKLKIHADDYGYSENISNNILYCYKNGIINSLSIMIDTTQELIELLKKSQIENINLHLNLTSLSSTNNKKDEVFLKNLSFTKLFFLNDYKKEICKKEIDYQIAKFKTHFPNNKLIVDGHHHIQIIPWILEYLIKTYSDEIESIRIPNEKFMFLGFKYFINPTFYRNLIASFVLKLLTRNLNKYSKRNFFGLIYSGIYSQKSFKKFLNKIQNDKNFYEVTFHPGTGLETEKLIFKKNHYKYVTSVNRKNEYELLTNLDDDFLFFSET